MAKTNGVFTYPVSSGVDDSAVVSAYGSIGTEFSNSRAFKDVSVNPILKTTHITSETVTSSETTVASAIFTEIRKGPHATSISNDAADKIGNRILPTTTSLSDHGTNKEITPSFKIKVYDSNTSAGNTNRKFVYSTTDDPATDTLGIDIENYDYFILLNPDIVDSSTQTNTQRPHFAKITAITSFDEFGDGLEFSPKYTGPIPKDTNFEVFKGPAKTDTDVMAVSYGLRGDASSSTDNYDVLNIVVTPNFYFYNERLEQDDQLDYMEKYTLTRLRWYNTLTNVAITEVDTHTQYQEGSSSVLFTTTGSSETDKLCQGMSIFNSSNVYLGNIKSISSNDFQLDFARIAITGTSTNFNVQIGKGISNNVFRTEAKEKGLIENRIGNRLDAVLIDSLRATDDADTSNFNPIFWHKAFPNAKRHETDSTTATAGQFDGNFNGPSRYASSDSRPLRNDIVPMSMDIVVNSPRNKMSKICNLSSLNNSGSLPLKIREGQRLKVMKTLFNDRKTFKTLPFKATGSSSASTITFNEMDSGHDYKLSGKISTDTILRIDKYYYVVNTVNDKSGNAQSFTVKARKTLDATTFTVATTVHDFSNEVVEIAPWTGVLNTERVGVDTQVHYADGNRLSISGATINKEDARLYGAKVSFDSVSTHQNNIDYADRTMEYLVFQDSSRKFYQNTNAKDRFYYYTGGYGIEEEVFNGNVEQIDLVAGNEIPRMRIEGRDDSASLLNRAVDRNLTFSEDIVHSSLNPVLPFSNEETLTSISVSGRVITHDASDGYTPTQYTLLFTRDDSTESNNMKFIGEVASAISNQITLSHEPLISLSSTQNIHYYDPFVESTYLSGTKAIGSNPSLTNTSTDFSAVSDKGVIFQDSFSFDRSLTTSRLEGTSNSGSFLKNRTLGFDIANPISINALDSGVTTQDSTFALQLSNETGVSTTKISKMTFSSELFEVVETISKDDGGFRISIAPICPLVMARLESNSVDTRSGYSFYMVNNNVNTGGFLHRIDSQIGETGNFTGTFYAPRETYRYWDTHRLTAGTITKSDAGIYENASKPQAISGYSIAYPIKANGIAPASPTLSPSTAPVLGSNMNDSNYTLRNATGSSFVDNGGVTNVVPPTHTIISTGVINTRKSDIDKILNHAPKAQNYEIFATGDLFPYSKLRYNNIGSQQLNFSDLACLLEGDGVNSTTSVSHSSYSGKSKMLEKRDIDYERASIKSATKSTDEIKRFGIARLVEATFDWHFNPIDPDSLPSPDDALLDIERYQMYATREGSPSTLAAVKDGSGNNTLTFTGGGTLTLAEGDAIFRADTGELVFIVASAISSMSSGDNQPANKLANVTGDNTALNTPAYIIRQYSLLSFEIFKFEDEGFQSPITDGVPASQTGVDFTSVYLARPNYHSESGIFKYAKLSNGGDAFLPPSIFIPFVFKSSTHSTNPNVSDLSPYHPEYTWHGDTALNSGSDVFVNSSRVIAGLVHELGVTGGNSINRSESYGLEPNAHPYENCIAVFRNIRKISKDGPSVPTDMFQTSAILGSRQQVSSHSAYATAFNGGTNDSTTDLDQHTVNTMIFQNNPNTYAIAGTHTRSGRVDNTLNSGESGFTDDGPKYFLGSKEGDTLTTTTHDLHDDTDFTSSDNGGLYRAQMMIKPVIDISDTNNVTLSQTNSARDTLTIDISNSDSQHTWLSFVPNLTGYYLVSEKGLESNSDLSLGGFSGSSFFDQQKGELFKSGRGGNIGFMAKILSHTTTQTTVNSTSFTHVLKLDRGIEASNTASFLSNDNQNARRPRFRLMRLAETTFRDTPKEIILNKLHATGLDYSETASRFDTGSPSGNSNSHLDEGVFSAYVLMNLDKAPESTSIVSIVPETPSNSAHNIPFTSGDVFDCFITDGTNKQRKQVTFTDTATSLTDAIRQREVKLTFDGTLTGNGVVSFSEVIDLELSKKPNLDNITRCHIGTSMTIGDEVEVEMQRIAKEAGLTTDIIQTQSEFTGNIVNSVADNVITCKQAIQNISVGDFIYTHEGYPVGVVGSISGSTLTITDVHTDADVDLWFVPSQNDELIKRDKKTFVATNNFTQTPAFNAMNLLASKKNLDFNIKGKKVAFRNVNDTSLLRKQTISHRTNRIIKVESNTSLFGRAVKVTVIGDRIRASVAKDDNGTEVTFIDATIRNISDAKIKATELLEIHSSNARKIKLTLEKSGLEMLEAGDIVSLDFPQSGIPADDYVIFEIENVLTGTITMTVNTFDKTIAERLSELDTQQSSSSSTLFNRNTERVTSGNLLTDGISVKTVLVAYTITGTGQTSNTGFDDLVGFTETVGFETGTIVLDEFSSED